MSAIDLMLIKIDMLKYARDMKTIKGLRRGFSAYSVEQ